MFINIINIIKNFKTLACNYSPLIHIFIHFLMDCRSIVCGGGSGVAIGQGGGEGYMVRGK